MCIESRIWLQNLSLFFQSEIVVPLGGTKSNLENEIWQDGFRSTLDFAIFKTLKNGITVKGELSAGVAKSLVSFLIYK